MLSLESLAELAHHHAAALPAKVAEFEIRGHSFNSANRPHLMGVINLSADSWYRESVVTSTDSALARARRLRAEGAHLIDLGAESSLHHAARIDPAQQIATLLLNLTGSRPPDDLYRTVAAHRAGIILCYVQGENVRAVGDFVRSPDHATALLDYFRREIDRAVQAGVHAIWIDPGLGFYYKNLQDSTARIRYQAETFLHTFRLRTLGWPVCHALPHAFEFFQDEVRSAESLFAVLALLGKTDLLRTHEIPKVRAVARTLGILS